MTARVLRDVPDRTYHRDEVEPGAPPTFSRSCAHTLLTVSPKHAAYEHPRIGGGSRKATKSMEAGSLAHDLLLGGAREISLLSYSNYKTKEAQAKKKDALEAGIAPVLERELLAMHDVVERVKLNLPFDLDSQQKEVTVLWGEPLEPGCPGCGCLPGSCKQFPSRQSCELRAPVVPCRARLDLLETGRGEIIIRDFKAQTSGYLDVAAFLRSLKYEAAGIQPAFYMLGVEQAFPEMAGRIRFEFIRFELVPPYDVATIKIEGARLRNGHMKVNRAVRTWAECVASGHWPGVGTVDGSEVAAWEEQVEIDHELARGENDGA